MPSTLNGGCMRAYSKILSMPPTFPRKSAILIALLNLGLFGVLIFYAWNSYLDLDSSRKCLRLTELSGIIDNLDEVLTMSARMATVTGDKNWEDRYRSYEPKLNSAITEALEMGKELGMSTAVAKTNAANIRRVSIENRAFELIHIGQDKAASALLSSPEYEKEKNAYRRGMERISNQINGFVSREDDASYFENCMLIVFVMLAAPALIISLMTVFVMIKRYESELKKSECRFRDMSEITKNWIWEIDSKMRFTYANSRVKELIGYTPEEVIGKTPAELMAPSEAADIIPFMDDVMNNPKPFLDSKRKIMHKDGSYRTIQVNGIPLYGHNNEFNGYRGICYDIT